MTPRSKALPPSASLPPVNALDGQTQEQLLGLVAGLVEIYCPLSMSLSSVIAHPVTRKVGKADSLAIPLADSGYVSEANDDEDGSSCQQKNLSLIRMDAFERAFAQRWITGFATRAEECPAFTSEDARQSAMEDAYMLIEALSLPPRPEEDEDSAAEGFRRDFTFKTAQDTAANVFLHDKLAGNNSADPDDVGLQSWGASIFFSRLLCQDPGRFGFGSEATCASPRIVELGAGTGLVSLALGALLPKLGQKDVTLVATDYHAAVLDNLRDNVKANMADHESVPITTCALDWSAPVWQAPLDKHADIIIATDVIYSPLHAEWVRDCASELLAPGGVFWLMAAVRESGRFEGVSQTVRTAFASDSTSRKRGDGLQLRIMELERLEKPVGVGRGDESFYELFKIGWQ